ncbi:MAG: rod shape-determining protein MreC [Holosporaceae bacterium]|nr:rod shape-determining protein MreC [Holosporaceae bacterium]
MNSLKVAYDQYGNYLERNCLNFYYFMSHDIDGTLIDLHNKNIELSEEIESLKHLRQENEEFRTLLSLKKTINFSVVAARVVSIFSNDFTQAFILNVGKTNGVKIDDVVKNSNGLIGRIIEVHDDWSRVLLITDINSCIPVKIGEQQVNAIMIGGNSNRLFIYTIHEDIAINEGDEVRTSGYGICENISIGKITKDGEKNMVRPFVNFNSLKYVIVLKKE